MGRNAIREFAVICVFGAWATIPYFLFRGPRILLQNRQNPGKWPRFSLLSQIFKADFSATRASTDLSGPDFMGRAR